MTSRVLNHRQARWSMFLSEFNFRLNYAPGKRNLADALSRRADYFSQEGDDVLLEQHKTLLSSTHLKRLSPRDRPAAAQGAEPKPIDIGAIMTAAIDNSELLQQFKLACRDDTKWREAIYHGNSDFTVTNDLVFHTGRLYVPPSL